MKYMLTIALALLATGETFAQSYIETDSIVRRYGGKFWSPEKLAIRINNDFSNDSVKARAIYSWIAQHVAYDTRKYQLMKSRTYRERLRKRTKSLNSVEYRKAVAKNTLRKRLGVCGDYSILFQRLCELSRIPCEIIPGNAKTTPTEIGRFPLGTDHAWNAVKINGRWRLVDVTWGSGYVVQNSMKFIASFDSSFFFTSPDLFFRHHFPREKRWLLVDRNDSAFAALPLYHSLRRDIVLVAPVHGIITANKDGIAFEFSSNGETSWSYYYHKGKVKGHYYVDATVNRDRVRFVVPKSASANDFLTICSNGSALVTFKVKSRKFLRTPFAGMTTNSMARNE